MRPRTFAVNLKRLRVHEGADPARAGQEDEDQSVLSRPAGNGRADQPHVGHIAGAGKGAEGVGMGVARLTTTDGGGLTNGPHTCAKAPLRDHGCSRRRGAPCPEKEIMIVAIYAHKSTGRFRGWRWRNEPTLFNKGGAS